ncbi:hypothetical protein [Mucilaginibacter psychrotolerans]|uniref:Uncharacterized protein n=1 Tax=Mucilaginibacter psychrotolerans TaxID=1524096 RepID=A0A4Y8S661_9SPHI|nr:hypothetical protein [Mucilaginibacter psychrotolerans]TFF33894.1 hypothetical protein E2R66_23745 [Mucilaginibacter psychrotolerans]
MPPFSLNIPCAFDKAYAVNIEDDGRVAYAYLTFYGDVVSDVWLYNRLPAPVDAFFNAEDGQPLNPDEYIKPGITVKPIAAEADITCEWDESKDGDVEVAILLHGKFIAELLPGAKPGSSVLVAKDGPLALVY